MKMEGWKDHLHFALGGEHVLFPNLHLESPAKFAVASLVAVSVCLTERLLTYAISKHWGPARFRRSRLQTALWRAALHWLVTFDRLMYMLIAMTFNIGLIVVTVTTLSFGQFIIEYLQTAPPTHTSDAENLKEPLLTHDFYAHPPSSPPSYPPSAPYQNSADAYQPGYQASNHPYQSHARAPSNAYRPPPTESQPQIRSQPSNRRTRSKPDSLSLYIHPSESNIARADAVAHELGLISPSPSPSPTSSCSLGLSPADPTQEEPRWELGKGRDVAREILGRY